MSKVTVFGLGFVGLTTALGFAHLGHTVYGIDVDEPRKALLRSGRLPFAEPYMEDVLKEHLDVNFHVTDDANAAVRESDCVYFCVGTPYGKDGSADLTYLFSAIDTAVGALVGSDGAPLDNRFRVLVTKSTIPPSTTQQKIVPYVQAKGQIQNNLGVANNPEFLREGHCWEDFINADRIVVGCEDERVRKMVGGLYKPMGLPVFYVSFNTGEFIKYLSNSLLATLISYSNEMAHIADCVGDIDVPEAFRILHMDGRWNNCNMTTYVYPGCGYGGYCLPKDTNALLAQSRVKGFEPPILSQVIRTNDDRPRVIACKIKDDLRGGKTLGVLGLSFKPGSDDVRDTPAAKIIRILLDEGVEDIVAYDPIAMDEFRTRYPDLKIRFSGSIEQLYDEADAVCILTAWPEFRRIADMGYKTVVDCRYML